MVPCSTPASFSVGLVRHERGVTTPPAPKGSLGRRDGVRGRVHQDRLEDCLGPLCDLHWRRSWFGSGTFCLCGGGGGVGLFDLLTTAAVSFSVLGETLMDPVEHTQTPVWCGGSEWDLELSA